MLKIFPLAPRAASGCSAGAALAGLGGGLAVAAGSARVLLAAASAANALFDFRGFEAGAVFVLKVVAVPRMGDVAGNLIFDELLDVAEEIDFIFGTEGDGEAIGSGATGPADAVDVGLGLVGEVVVYDQSDVFHIDPASGDVGGDENGNEALFELCEGFFALGLGFIAVDGFGFVAGGGQGLGEFVGAVFGPAEHDGQLGFFGLALFFKKLLQELQFIAAIDEAEFLLDSLGGGHFRSDGDAGGIVEDFLGERNDVRGEGRGEKQGLFFLGEKIDNAVHIAKESHVQHAIDFI